MLKKIIVMVCLMLTLTSCGNLFSEVMTIRDQDCELNCKIVITYVDDEEVKKQYFINDVEVTENMYWNEHRALWSQEN